MPSNPPWGCSSTDGGTGAGAVCELVTKSCMARRASIRPAPRLVESRTWTTKWSGAPVGVRTSAASSETHTWWPSLAGSASPGEPVLAAAEQVVDLEAFARADLPACSGPPSGSRARHRRWCRAARRTRRWPRRSATRRRTSAMPIGASSIATRNCIRCGSARPRPPPPVTSTRSWHRGCSLPSPAGTSWLDTCTMRACVGLGARKRDADQLGVERPPGTGHAGAMPSTAAGSMARPISSTSTTGRSRRTCRRTTSASMPRMAAARSEDVSTRPASDLDEHALLRSRPAARRSGAAATRELEQLVARRTCARCPPAGAGRRAATAPRRRRSPC